MEVLESRIRILESTIQHNKEVNEHRLAQLEDDVETYRIRINILGIVVVGLILFSNL
jgi:hypothetical protein